MVESITDTEYSGPLCITCPMKGSHMDQNVGFQCDYIKIRSFVGVLKAYLTHVVHCNQLGADAAPLEPVGQHHYGL